MKWIQWLIDNAWSLVIIVGVLMQLIQAMTKKKGGQEPTEEQPPKEYEFEDPDLAERTRRIREEIQRKIEQRTQARVEPPADPAEVVPPVIREVAVRPLASTGHTRLDSQRHAQILEEQAALMEKLQEATRLKAAVSKRLEFESATADHSTEKLADARSALLGDLSTPQALRRAFVLREVLGPPVALRRSSG